MTIDLLTLFPAMAQGVLGESILGRAQRAGLVQIRVHQLRDYAKDKHRIVDDRPFGNRWWMRLSICAGREKIAHG